MVGHTVAGSSLVSREPEPQTTEGPWLSSVLTQGTVPSVLPWTPPPFWGLLQVPHRPGPERPSGQGCELERLATCRPAGGVGARIGPWGDAQL